MNKSTTLYANTDEKNNFKNAESDTKVNIHTDHYPVIAEVQIQLNAKNNTPNKRPSAIFS